MLVCLGMHRAMIWIMYLSWLVGPALQLILLAYMVRRRLHNVFPRFFSYIVFQTLKSGVLLVVFHYYESVYFDAYWTGNAVSVLLAVAVMDEILRTLFKEYGGAQTLGSMIFRWTSGLLLLLAIVNALTSHETSVDRVVATVLNFDRSVRIMQCGLFCLLMLLCRYLRHCWRQRVFGIALGFGVFASIELILVSIAIRYGSASAPIISIVKSLAYNAVTLLWIGYLKQQSQSIPEMEIVPQLTGRTIALVPSVPAGSGSDTFVSMVEQLVEDVLSRNPWPRPVVKRSQIVGRGPGPRENN